MKRNSKIFSFLFAGIISCLAVLPATGCVQNENASIDGFSSMKIIKLSDGTTYTPTISASPSEKTEISLLSGEIYEVCKFYEPLITDGYNENGTDVFAPTPLSISWECADKPLYSTLYISTNEDMSNAEGYVTLDNSVTLEYLFMGYDYYYQIEAKYSDKLVKSRIFSFSTEYLPRTVYVDDNVSNTRDWGGYLCDDGIHRVKQGIVYRGGKLENITESGKAVMLNHLGIKTDLDVRGDGTAGTSTSPLGASVNYIETTGPYYLGTTGINVAGPYREALLTEIRAFTKPENFPIYVHCSLGRDRTGTLCFLINALLGVGETDLYRDYEISMMSAMGHADGQTASHMVGVAFAGLYNYFKSYYGNTYAKKVETYMLEIGITKEEIQLIKDNMLEEVK